MQRANWRHAAITWVILIATIFLSHLNQQWTESFYSLSIYSALHQTFSWIFSWTPFSFVLIGIVCFTYKTIIKLVKTVGLESKLFLLQYRALWVIALFYIFWGYNYGRLDIESRLGLQDELNMDRSFISLYDSTINNLNSLSGLSLNTEISEIESHQVRAAMKDLGYKHLIDNVAIKPFWPKGWLLRIATAGFYFPYTFEANYDPGLHELQLPFVTAHEMAHAFGEPQESAANFIAYIVCSRSKNASLRYAGEIALYQYIKHLVPIEISTSGKKRLNSHVIQDLNSIKLKMDNYPDILPEIRDLVYNTFLRIQGIKDGEKNYSRFVDLLIQYKNKK